MLDSLPTLHTQLWWDIEIILIPESNLLEGALHYKSPLTSGTYFTQARDTYLLYS